MINFKTFIPLLKERHICISFYDKGSNTSYRNYIYSDELFNLILEKCGEYYVDQVDSDSSLPAITLINPDDWEYYKENCTWNMME